ncbi:MULTISPECIES: preprotein translocase subunit SecE [Hallerella]|uniref:Protein translocase subunit SecE n=1 Tax=Hallerella succinigenes TaxID=1896222 RepID=A0A2M9A6W9_9BACT|nr:MULTISPECIES: preprotein translocase subunit SecE [Hallerella]MCR5028797.1 preprotein translocase subunit SecE [Fibrobacter sp.]MCI6874029.1 preprotein translocase subunit SecE [Hallerella sp.]MDD6091725.1 preprotein translocase subunit SecE [Hallerella succinigenes]MDY6285294.1 preprotein translocase subunit SecE [Fibrobacter sp.]MDY6370562.1 preprotein translocase subunit SecE [Fibrobacter sp.]
MQKIQQYIKEVIQEMKKVTWPTWEELKGSTLVVMLFSVIMGCYIAAIDLGLSFIVDKLLGRG